MPSTWLINGPDFSQLIAATQCELMFSVKNLVVRKMDVGWRTPNLKNIYFSKKKILIISSGVKNPYKNGAKIRR